MRNYRIAFFTVDWNYELVESTLHGLKQFVDDHENVRLRVFDCFGKDIGNAKDHSEYAIFDLANLGQFDGALIQGNQIVLKSARETLARRVTEAGIPAVTVDCPIEGCTLVSVDNRQAQYDLAAHVIRAHGAKRLAYLTGILDNGSPEARQRLEGFQDACRDGGIAEADISVFHCTWRTSDGVRVAREWLRSGKPLPDAFICGNDDMAIGVLEALRAAGCRVPEDVIVTGFDNLSSAELSSPRLSTVRRDYALLDYRSMQVLLDKIDGTEQRDFVPFEYEIVCSESCGCRELSRPSYIRNKYFQSTRYMKDFYTLQDQMAEELFEASTLPELMGIVENNHRVFGCDNIYLCVNRYYYDNYDKKQWTKDSETFDSEMVLAACGGGATPNGVYRGECFPTSRLLPDGLMERERFLMFYPLHYNTYSIGYLAVNSISDAAKMNLHKSIFSFLEIAIENVRKKCLLQQLNDELDELYVHDALTGFYNRFGYARFGQQIFDGFMAGDGGARILFVDMDDMKGINDQFGHDAGDDAIQRAARILQQTCGAGDFLMRYGGDEFLVIASRRETDLEHAIQRAASDANAACDTPYQLGLSVGVIDVSDGDERNLDECVQFADALMYKNKKRRKGR
ncbi:MAG: GGDEF domain-containing protein [Clostridia bacterium]|nr:GGDEF domain-containing protein [Clostridia bacterium]